jgi:hypothetical protein
VERKNRQSKKQSVAMGFWNFISSTHSMGDVLFQLRLRTYRLAKKTTIANTAIGVANVRNYIFEEDKHYINYI